MSQLPFFTWHNILCAAVIGAVGAVCIKQRVLLRLPFLPRTAPHNNMHYARQHGVRLVRLPRFGEMFQWRKSSVCCFGVRGAVNVARGTVSYTCAAVAAVFCARDANSWQH
jgi:hypothetical protein